MNNQNYYKYNNLTGGRVSPTKSATLYIVGTKKTGNDGNIWIVAENINGVKSWKLHKKPSNKKPSNKKPSTKKTHNKKIYIKGSTPTETKLLKSVVDGDLKLVIKFLDDGADIEMRDPFYDATPFLVAADYGKLDILKYLIKRGSDTKVIDNYGNTALHLATINNHLDTVKYLVKHGSYIDAKDIINSATALHYAVSRNYFKIVKYLIQFGAKIELKDKYGDTPLKLASRHDFVDILKYLLKYKATN